MEFQIKSKSMLLPSQLSSDAAKAEPSSTSSIIGEECTGLGSCPRDMTLFDDRSCTRSLRMNTKIAKQISCCVRLYMYMITRHNYQRTAKEWKERCRLGSARIDKRFAIGIASRPVGDQCTSDASLARLARIECAREHEYCRRGA